MRSPLALLGVLGLVTPLSAGCAHTLESRREESVVFAVDTSRSASTSEVTEPARAVVDEPAPARPRLSRTVTLGEGATEAPYIASAQAAQGTGQAGPNVIVNNNITVGGYPGGYGGYPGGYGGYGGYPGGYGGYGRPSNSGVGYGGADGRGSGSHSAWAPSGWEGAGRTARPGATPGVGGNWPSPSSHGPRQLK